MSDRRDTGEFNQEAIRQVTQTGGSLSASGDSRYVIHLRYRPLNRQAKRGTPERSHRRSSHHPRF